ncbi:MAG: HEPN domain-containing protein [Magnetococcales bacterium]|nr:HEPN domain-containing protein [Magnetococcales bacterium]
MGTLITPEAIAEIARTIVERFNPDRIVLFGSHAHGTPTSDSDLDLLVVMPTDLPKSMRAAAIRKLFNPAPCALDLHVYTPEDMAYWQGTVNHVMTEALLTGRTLYESPSGSKCRLFSAEESTMHARQVDLCQAWLRKAGNDLTVAHTLMNLPNSPPEIVCFHMQQAIEKSLKGLLTWHGIRFPKTHDLLVLHDLAASLLPNTERFRTLLQMLGRCAVEWRYPGEDADEPNQEELAAWLPLTADMVQLVNRCCA